MTPRYALLKADRGVCPAWIEDDARGRQTMVLADGREWCEAPARVLYQWEGSPIAVEGGAARRREALQQLAEGLDPGKGGDLWDLAALHDALPPGEGLIFDAIAARVLGETSSGWDRARLFLALVDEPRLFRRSKQGFVARLAVEIRQRDARLAEKTERNSWLARVREWLAQLEAGGPLPPEPDAERFVGHLRSLAVEERHSPHWKSLAGPLGLHIHHATENRILLKRWLEAAGAWPGWSGVWLARADVARSFSPELEALAGEMAAAPLDTEGRADYRGAETYSFDSSHTEDFDDAVTVLEAGGDGLSVAVHVAEPDERLVPGHPLFDEAARRMYSVYTPEGIFPMLPEALSNGRCALKAGADREAVTFVLRIGPAGGKLERIERSLVRVDRNLNYESGRDLLAGNPETWGRLAELAELLAQRRVARGAHLVERAVLTIDRSDPERIRLHRVERQGIVHRMVEELAVLTNCEAGGYCDRNGLPAFYRVQPQARSARGGGTDPSSPPRAARFSLQGDVHTGLACPRYVQTTSPIRRFTDLIVQRQIVTHLSGARPAIADITRLEGWLEWAEQRGSTYIELVRRIEDQWKRRYLSQNPGLELAGVVRKRGRTAPGKARPARVWLEYVELDAEADLPESMEEGTRDNFRLAEVDLDRHSVRVTRA